MIPATPEKRSIGPLVAFIDLLFLMISFFVLVIFFVQTRHTQTQSQLQSAQQELVQVSQQRDVLQATLAGLGPTITQFMAQRRQEAEQRRELAARELRRSLRETVRLSYEVLPGGRILYDGTPYDLAAFQRDVVDRYRETSWIAFRALARPDTPFGEVVASRVAVLKNSGEFDTYWDNLTQNKREP